MGDGEWMCPAEEKTEATIEGVKLLYRQKDGKTKSGGDRQTHRVGENMQRWMEDTVRGRRRLNKEFTWDVFDTGRAAE